MSAQQPLDVQALLDAQGFSSFQWLVFGLCFCIVLLDGFDTAAIGYIAPALSQQWGVARPALAPVLSAALVGLAAGAILGGPLADRLGRKRILVAAVLVFGAACLWSSRAADLDALTRLRFLTGLGLGAAMANAVTLMSEFCPARRRAILTNAMFCGFPLGAACGGFLAAWIIPHFGWRSVLALGGIAPLVLGLALLRWLPESVRYMVAHGLPVERVRAVLGRIVPAALAAQSYVRAESAGAGGAALVLSRPFLPGSFALWVAYFMGLVIFYALINWMPILFRDSGLAPRAATLIAALFPLGGIGAIASGWLMDRFDADRIIAAGYALTALAVFAIGRVVGSVELLMVIVFVGGALMNTAQSSMPAHAASFYPTRGRATGVAWMLGVGRFGAIAGSFLVAELTRRSLDVADIFAIVAIPGLFAAGALLLKQALRDRLGAPQAAAATSQHAPATGTEREKEQWGA